MRVLPSFHSSILTAGFDWLPSRNELIDLEQPFTSRGVFQNRGFDARDTAFSASRNLSVTTYGASAAVDLRRAWIGGGVLVQHFELGFTFDRYLHQTFYGAPDPSQQVLHFTQAGNDTGLGAVVGVVVPVSDAKIGVSYRRAPRADFSSFSGGLVGTQQHSESTFKVPDRFALGASNLFGTRFLVTAEYTRVFHSQLLSAYVKLVASQGESGDRVESIHNPRRERGPLRRRVPAAMARQTGDSRRRLVRSGSFRALPADRGQRFSRRTHGGSPVVRPQPVARHGGHDDRDRRTRRCERCGRSFSALDRRVHVSHHSFLTERPVTSPQTVT